jgi:iron complex outermembrane receptor protein
MDPRLPSLLTLCAMLLLPAAAHAEDAPPPADLTQLSVGQLAELEVTTVSKRPEKRARAAAAVFVITREDIRRSGAQHLAQLLRFAPGLQVARLDANKWAVGVRGFASRLSRSVLVLVDGRSVYNPLFAGVYWEAQDTLLDDIERIEVIRGPGGALWGANAVNGVINVITRHAADTQGGLVGGEVGTRGDRSARVRYGAHAGAVDYRAWGSYFEEDGMAEGAQDFDAWHVARGGFHADWTRSPSDTINVQGDLYSGRAGELSSVSTYEPPFSFLSAEPAALSGGNLLGRWQHAIAADSEVSVQAYYDHTHRVEPSFREDRDTLDLQLQHGRPVGARHHIVWGAQLRSSVGRSAGVPTLFFDPPTRRDTLAGAFAQDEVALAGDAVHLTVGAKLEHSNFTGVELQPSVRFLYGWNPHQAAWLAVSRAVRTPSRTERDLSLSFSLDPASPTFGRVLGDEAFRSETVIAYEAGYRWQRRERFLLDAAVFLNDYDHLLSLEPGTPFQEQGRRILPQTIANGLAGRVYGGELSADARVSGRWRVHGSWSLLRMDLAPRPGSRDVSQESQEGASPRHQMLVRSSWDLPHAIEADAADRHVAALPALAVPAYDALDVRLGWRPRDAVQIALVGRNVLDRRHLECPSGPGATTTIARTAYATVTVRW